MILLAMIARSSQPPHSCARFSPASSFLSVLLSPVVVETDLALDFLQRDGVIPMNSLNVARWAVRAAAPAFSSDWARGVGRLVSIWAQMGYT